MRWFSFFAALMLIVRSFAPCCFADWSRMPHAHMMLGAFSADAFAHHHEPMPCPAAIAPGTPSIGTGIILSLPFGDWQNFLANFFLVAFAHARGLDFDLPMIALIAAQTLLLRARFIRPLDPPPRQVFA
jgi:hypothetical protein